MVHILIEENYAHNNRIDQILQGMASIIKKKRIGVKLYTDISKLEKNARVVVLLCASLKWATDTIEVLNAAGIHPLLFGFQYIDTMYEYSCITPTYTKTMYLLASHLLSCVPGEIALLGYNSDSLPDRLKLMGVRHAAERFGVEARIFRNKGDVAACIADFAENGQAAKNIVCVNDGIAVILRNEYPELINGRQMCSCSGMKISEFMHPRYPTSTINYFKAGARLAELYLFLDKCDVIGSTVMTIDMGLDLGNQVLENDIPFSGVVHSSAEVNFYGDALVKEVENLDRMLTLCDDLDMQILRDTISGISYEQIAEECHLAPNTVKYRIYAMVRNAGVSSRKEMLTAIAKYHLDLQSND